MTHDEAMTQLAAQWAADDAAIDQFTRGYIEAALWASTDDAGEPLDAGGYTLSNDARATMTRECWQFLRDNDALLDAARAEGNADAALGHDFWLTRCRHGVGYWDRPSISEALGNALTEAAHKAGERNLYVSDAGMIEQYES